MILNLCSLSQEKAPNIQIIDDELTIRAKHTYFKNYLSEIFWTNRYIKIKVNGEIFNDSVNPDFFKINILDTSYNKINFKTLFRGQRGLGDETRKMKKEKKWPTNELSKRRKFYILRVPVRIYFISGLSSAGMGYRLKKGVYYLYVEYYDEQKRIRHKSENVKLIVK
jgi:hypothetical protein